jgi:hypothetical protein
VESQHSKPPQRESERVFADSADVVEELPQVAAIDYALLAATEQNGRVNQRGTHLGLCVKRPLTNPIL